jgi:tetratricopeptide (TPR) repeat protein
MALLRIGDRYYGLGDYAKAAETYRAAKAKGADASLADLRTGVALASAGDKAGATAALKSVTGARAGVAQLWLLYLESRG